MVNWIDLLIITIAIFGLERGWRLGLVTQSLSLVGFFVGLFVGSWIAPFIARYGHDAIIRSLITLGITIGLAIIFSTLGELAGLNLRGLSAKLHLERLDSALGVAFEVVAVLVAAWLIATPASNLQIADLASDVRHSLIIQTLDAHLPPAPNTLARLEHVIEPNGFPHVFLGPEPFAGDAALPPPAAIADAVTRDKASVVQVEGEGCGGLVTGSGFVAAPGLVATNAHVVAGIKHPFVVDRNGEHAATPVYFDPNLDFAVLRVKDLAGAPLPITSTEVAAGTPGGVLGYPGGGPFSSVVATVLAERYAVGRNIYGEGPTARTIYEIKADVEPGNSGGPLVETDGTVMGVVFAKGETNANVGYTLTSKEILPALQKAAASGSVNTGLCSVD